MTRYLDPVTVDSESGSITYISERGIPGSIVSAALTHADVAQAMSQWTSDAHSGGAAGMANSLLNRNRYVQSLNVYDQMVTCLDAVTSDDVLASLAEASEALAFHDITFDCLDNDEEDVWDQIADDLDLASKLREIWRDLFKVSQSYVAIIWGTKNYTVRTAPLDQLPPDEGPRVTRKRRKQYPLQVPTALLVIHPCKILPVNITPFSPERFVYLASAEESRAFSGAMDGRATDPLVSSLVERKYDLTERDKEILYSNRNTTYALDPWLLRDGAMFRHTLTRPYYERLAAVRMQTVLPLLDIKAHLRASDRSTLIGTTNFIVVIRRGTDKWPAKPAEIEQLSETAKAVARLPILVGDHRLSVEIVTPKLDNTLDEQRYAALDQRLVTTALCTFGGITSQAAQAVKVSYELACRVVESRRSELSQTITDELFKRIRERNPILNEVPQIVYHPRRVSMTVDAAIMNAILKLRDRGDLSRETMLSELDFDQDVELVRRVRERRYDPSFQSSVPFSSPQTNPFNQQNPPDTGPNNPGNGPGPKEEPKPVGRPPKSEVTL